MTFREWLLDKSSLLSGTLMEHLNNIATCSDGGGGGMADGVHIVPIEFEEEEIVEVTFSDIEDIEINIIEEEIIVIEMEE